MNRMLRVGTTALLAEERRARHAWELFVSGDDTCLDVLRPEVALSWRRAKEAGVDSGIKRIPPPPKEELDRALFAGQRLVQASAGVVEILRHAVGMKPWSLAVTHVNRVNLLAYTTPSAEEKVSEFTRNLGYVHEAFIGTNSIEIALRLGRPFRIRPYEFYARVFQEWDSYSAPIRGLSGDIVGVLSLAECRTRSVPLTAGLVTSAASQIEEQLADLEKLQRSKVLEEYYQFLLRHPDAATIALDVHGRILALSGGWARLADLAAPDATINRPLKDLRAFQCPGVLDCRPEQTDNGRDHECKVVFPQRGIIRTATVRWIGQGKHWAGLLVTTSPLSRSASKGLDPPGWKAKHGFEDMVAQSALMRGVVDQAKRASGTDWPVLLLGETGTGKELIAHSIHKNSDRSQGPFVALNLAAVPKELALSELFGYDEGAFSGSIRGGKPGKIELANSGTLFLDELADMPVEVQVALLRFLEDGKIIRLGAIRPITADVRVIAAMNLELAGALATGKLRADLFHRLNVFSITLPPLRERPEDLAPLCRHFLDTAGFGERTISVDAVALLRKYHWPGNARELRNVLIRTAVSYPSKAIDIDSLREELFNARAAMIQTAPVHPCEPKQLGWAQIARVFDECGGNVSKAAESLKMHRTTFYRILRRHKKTRQDLQA